VEQAAATKGAYWLAFQTAHKKATLEYDAASSAKQLRVVGHRPEDIAKKWDDTLSPDNPEKLTARALKAWSASGRRPGASPQPPGRKMSKSKSALVAVTKTYTKLMQLEGQCQKPKELVRKLVAAAAGTGHEALVDTLKKRRAVLEQLRVGEDAVSVLQGESIDKRRVDSLTYENVVEWFSGWTHFLEARKFAVKRKHPVSGTEMWYVSRQKRARIINCDEMHLVMTTELEKGGPRALVYGDQKLGASGRVAIVNARHISAMYATAADRTVMPPYYMFDSAASAENMGLNAAWLLGLPRVMRYVHGFDDKQPMQPGCEVSEKGGAVKGTFHRFIHTSVIPSFPNHAAEWEYDSDGSVDSVGDPPIRAGPVIVKSDMGPDRVTVDEDQLLECRQLHVSGILPYPGLPNGTAANQEMDNLFGELKEKTADVADDIVAEREQLAATAREARKKAPPINLTNADLGRIVDGRPGDKGAKRPFRYAFSTEKVDRAWSKVGAVGEGGWVTMQCLHHPKVRAATSSTTALQLLESVAADASAPPPVARETRSTASQPAAAAAPMLPPPSSLQTRNEQKAILTQKHEAAMAELSKHGFAAEVFKVVPKVPPKPVQPKGAGKGKAKAFTEVDVAEPTEDEIELSAELKNGASGFAVWKRGAKTGMYSDEVIQPILERIRNDKQLKVQAQGKRDEVFEKLREEALQIIDGCLSIEHLTTTKLVTLTRYVFQAMGAANVTKVTVSRDAMLINLMAKLDMNRLLLLLENPFKLTGDKLPSDWPELYVPSTAKGAGASSSGGSAYLSFAAKFGDVEFTVPDDLDLPEDLEPLPPPVWLVRALKFKSDSAELLIGKPILFKFEEEDGGWAVGILSESLTDEENTCEVIEGDITGFKPINFEVNFEDGALNILLELEDYATSASCPNGGWCLIGGKASGKSGKPKGAAKGNGKAVADCAPNGPLPLTKKLSPNAKERRKAELQAEIDALNSMSCSDDDVHHQSHRRQRTGPMTDEELDEAIEGTLNKYFFRHKVPDVAFDKFYAELIRMKPRATQAGQEAVEEALGRLEEANRVMYREGRIHQV
jgi:hypothetical protein